MIVSLIITTYNRTNLLRNTLLSVLSQTYQPHELVISDDGSSEDIVSGVKDLVDIAPFAVKFVSQPDKGFRLAKCRNNGVRESVGDFIIFFDQDLAFSKDYLKTMATTAKRKRFIVGCPIRLTREQSEKVTRDMILNGDFSPILTKPQQQLTIKQYQKEFFYAVLYKLKLRRIGPKLRGGIAGFFKDDFIKVNGYDERYIGWGNEDDDLGIRFYGAGISGLNPFKNDYVVHLFHERFHSDERINKRYYKKRKKEITKYAYRCEYGFEPYGASEKLIVHGIKN